MIMSRNTILRILSFVTRFILSLKRVTIVSSTVARIKKFESLIDYLVTLRGYSTYI